MDAEMDGFATGLSNAITKDGQTTISQNIPFNNKKITGLGDATLDTDALNRQSGDARYARQSDIDEYIASTNYASTDVASATTCDIGAALTARVRITGTTTITSFGSDINTLRYVTFAGILTLTHNATSLILPGGNNITTADKDNAIFASDASGYWRCLVYWRYTPTSGTALLKGDNLGWMANAAAGTDYVAPGGALGTPSSGTLTSCTGLPIASGVSGLGTNVGTFLATPSYTNLAAALTGSVLQTAGKQTVGILAGSLVARTTNGAASGTAELTTNKTMLYTLDFDATTEEGAGFWVPMPKSWNESTITFQVAWTAASSTGDVVWGLAAYAFSDDDAMDTATSGQQTVTDTLITANDMHISAESSALTIGGTPAVGDWVYFELTREAANGSDTLSADAKLIGLRLYITTDATNDT